VPVCTNCQAFDTLTWQAPPANQMATPTGLEMLPLIVGSIEDRRDMPEPNIDADAAQTEPAPQDMDDVFDAELVDDGEKSSGDTRADETKEKA